MAVPGVGMVAEVVVAEVEAAGEEAEEAGVGVGTIATEIIERVAFLR